MTSSILRRVYQGQCTEASTPRAVYQGGDCTRGSILVSLSTWSWLLHIKRKQINKVGDTIKLDCRSPTVLLACCLGGCCVCIDADYGASTGY